MASDQLLKVVETTDSFALSMQIGWLRSAGGPKPRRPRCRWKNSKRLPTGGYFNDEEIVVCEEAGITENASEGETRETEMGDG